MYILIVIALILFVVFLINTSLLDGFRTKRGRTLEFFRINPKTWGER